MAESSTLTFVSSVQRGTSVGIDRADDPLASGGFTRAPLVVKLDFNNLQSAITPLELVGPGDIVGLDPRSIVRTYPRRDDNDAESEHFVTIEFDQADLPWRYTPAKPKGDRAATNDQLRPWFTLVVLAEDGVEFAAANLAPASITQKLPILTVKRRFLPNPTELWAWAHLQANQEILEDPTHDPLPVISAAIEGRPGAVVARVMSPRILKKQTAYHAFLVPTFEAGRRAGVGEALAGVDGLTPAWKVNGPDDEQVRLPVYYDWRFQTGTAGSFESLISALVPTPPPDTVGRRGMDVGDPGLGLPQASADAEMQVGGALQSVASAAAILVEPKPEDNWVIELSDFVGVSELEVVDEEDGQTKTVKVVSPPLYARWYAAQDALSKPSPLTNPPWFYRLNSDPRYRVPAALGTEAVQREQQSLMEAAWRQIDQLRAINYERKVLQTAREALGRFMVRHVNVGFFESKLTITGRFHSRFLVPGKQTTFFDLFTRGPVAQTPPTARRSPLPAAFFDPQWRRFSSPRGLLGRRLGLPKLPGQEPGLFDPINKGTIRLAPPPPPPSGTSTSETTWGGATPGGPTGKETTDLAQQLGKDGLVFWGLVLFWVGRRLLVDLQGQYWWLLHRLIQLGGALIRLANDPQLVREKLRDALRNDKLDVGQVDQAPKAKNFAVIPTINLFDPTTLPPEPGPLPPNTDSDSPDAIRFRAALRNVAGYFQRPRQQITMLPVDLNGLLTNVFKGLDPAISLVESQNERLTFDKTVWKAADPLEPILSAPEFDRPMYQPLRDISNEWILPGLGDIKPDTLGLVVTNQRFVEAYMAGLNHEMTRELIWNEYPVDQRSTYFRQFWDARSFIDTPDKTHPAEELKDIKPIRSWPATAELGQNSSRPSAGNGQQVVLLVRGQLIKRYPNVVVYAATSALRDPPPPGYKERHPVFSGFLGGDIAYYGFDLVLDEVKDADDPWFFILQEHPSEPRFHIPGTPPDGELFARAAVEFIGLQSAAVIADNAYHNPVRIAVKGRALVNPPSP